LDKHTLLSGLVLNDQTRCRIFRLWRKHMRAHRILASLPRNGIGFAVADESDAHLAFQSIGKAAVLIMLVVGIACAFAAVGLWRNAVWGIRLALIILAINVVGDLFNATVRHDYRSLIGLPIGGAMIFYLARYRKADSSS